MFKLNKADQEILNILKETFLSKNVQPMSSDEHLRLLILRSFLYVSLFGLLMKAILWFLGEDVSGLSKIISMPIALFFGFLFLHINNKSENTSVIIFGLTWVSIVLALYS